MLDRRPPHYRCPAVPGLNSSARAILMAPGSSDLPLNEHLPIGNCFIPVASYSATLRQPARHPSCICSGLDSTAGPPGTRARSWRPYRGTTGKRLPDLPPHVVNCCAVLLTAAPDDCGPPDAVVSPVACLQQLWLRNSTTAPSCELRVLLPAVRLYQACLDLVYGRNSNHATTPMSTLDSIEFCVSGEETVELCRRRSSPSPRVDDRPDAFRGRSWRGRPRGPGLECRT